jgi:hypothetical protein
MVPVNKRLVAQCLGQLARLEMVSYVWTTGMGSPFKRRKADDSYRVMQGGGSVDKGFNFSLLPHITRVHNGYAR